MAVRKKILAIALFVVAFGCLSGAQVVVHSCSGSYGQALPATFHCSPTVSAAAGSSGWANVQAVANTSCPASTTCSVTVSSTGSGHLLVAYLGNGGTTQRTISSVSGGGSWTVSSAAAGHDVTCGCGTNIAYVLSSTSGATTITVTASGTTNSAILQFYEFSYSGTASLNTGATPAAFRDQATNTTTPAGASLTLSANNSVVIQVGYFGGSASAIDSSYTGTFPGGDGAAYKLNISSGTAPNWTQSPSAAGAFAGIAFEAN